MYRMMCICDYFNSRPSARGDEKREGLKASTTFQFTPLREGRPSERSMTPPADYFNSRPSARGDQIAGTHTRRFPHFNSRPSARGDDSRTYEVKPELISIHAPPRGATRCAGTAARPTIFQFTPLREGRPGLELTATTVMHFNSRPSARGDATSRTRWLSAGFQFTPLREGRRFRVYLAARTTPYFNSRPSARGDTLTLLRWHLPFQFQFTPLREGRHIDGFCLFSLCIFQFTPLREGRHLQIRGILARLVISIHAPPRGATVWRRERVLITSISIHAPPRGATER